MAKGLILSLQPPIYQLEVVLEGVKPAIWRRFLVSSDIKLTKLHRVLQIIMGWENSHLHEFKPSRISYGEPVLGVPRRMPGTKKPDLRALAPKEKDKFTYIYDFGDGWEHRLTVEKIMDSEPGKRHPVCLAGERACPPEDCGGIPGYEMLLSALLGPKNADERDLVDWAGDYDPDYFDLNAINARLERMR
jgi:hypothetical protein